MKIKKKSVGEIIRYSIAGVTTTLVNLGIYQGLVALGMDYKAANLIAIICAKVYGYIVNKLFVFKFHCNTRKELLAEIGKYIGARGITGIIDYAGVILLVEVCSFDKVVSKYGITVAVIVLNYIFGKLFVFKESSKE